MKLKFVAALLAGSALCISAPAFAQAPAPQDQPAPTEPDQSDAEADATIANAQAVDEAQAKIDLLQAQVEALQASIEQVKASMVKATPTWKGAPQWDDKDAGFSFKPKGLIQWDAGYVGFPRGNELRSSGTTTPTVNPGGLNYQNLGWNSRGRRLTIGADGTIPGGFRYSAEFNFAQGAVDYEDIYLAYDFKNSPLTMQIGHIYPFSSLETMTSSKYTSFMERAGITDAFNYNRRLGVAFIATDKKADSWTVQGGIFNEPINDAAFTHTGWQASLRGIYSPQLGNVRLHVGANVQYRENRRESRAANYQERPYTQVTDQRFISTGNIASKGDFVAGLELAAIMKSFHFAAEAQKVWLHGTFNAAEFVTENGDLTSNDVATGSVYNDDPSFWGGYAEIGYFLTGETRNYKGGSFQRVKVLHPFNDGGWGAFQINGRVDYIDLSDSLGGAVVAPPAGSSYSLGSNSTFVNGGKQTGLLASLIWNPTDYVRFMAQYSHAHVVGGPRATVSTAGNPSAVPPVPPQLGMFPVGTTTAPDERKYNVSVFTMRAQVDF
jgi:phosphate-selective porin OprO and OprP